MRGVGVLVKDPEIAETLYKTMGFKEIWKGKGENEQVKLIDMQLPGPSGDYVELVERPMPVDAAQAGRSGRIILEVADIRTAHKLAAQRHASGLTSPVQSSGKGWSFDVLDPDGTMVTFEQPLPDVHKTATTR